MAIPTTARSTECPRVFVGGAEARRLKSLAAQGASARVVVRAKVDRAETTNVIATLPGRSSQRIVLGTNTDGQSWVQENGVAGLIAFARYYAGLPKRCRSRTLQIAFASAHDAVVSDGMEPYSARLDAQYDKGSVAFAFAVEHLGTREIVPNAAGNRLRFTGKGEPFLFAAGNSDLLRQTAVNITKRRKLDRTAVLQGLGFPTAGQVPPICNMGGLGSFFQTRLVPTLAMISGPWSLYAPSFRGSAIDYKRMRSQLLAVGDTVLALDGAPMDADRRGLPRDARAASAGGADLPQPIDECRSSPRGPVSDSRGRRRTVRRSLVGAWPSWRRRLPAAITQPPQPKSGPGRERLRARRLAGQLGRHRADAWYVFEPVRPRPRSARSRS